MRSGPPRHRSRITDDPPPSVSHPDHAPFHALVLQRAVGAAVRTRRGGSVPTTRPSGPTSGCRRGPPNRSTGCRPTTDGGASRRCPSRTRRCGSGPTTPPSDRRRSRPAACRGSPSRSTTPAVPPLVDQRAPLSVREHVEPVRRPTTTTRVPTASDPPRVSQDVQPRFGGHDRGDDRRGSVAAVARGTRPGQSVNHVSWWPMIRGTVTAVPGGNLSLPAVT